MYRRIIAAVSAGMCALSLLGAQAVIYVEAPADGADMTMALQAAADSAASLGGRPVEIALSPGVYNITREKATARLQHVSNTTSAAENPDPTKHFGLYLHGLRNVTVSGHGARIVTHGEMSWLGIDSCRNITVRNISVDAADPSVAEMTVTGRTDTTLTVALAPRTSCRISPQGQLFWAGCGWEFTGGIAQLRNATHTWRTQSPMERYVRAERSGQGVIFHYAAGEAPQAAPGEVYQLRHSFRTEVATLINRSQNVTLSDMEYHFLGNFGIVGQMSSDITLDAVDCSPGVGSGRTCAGFADFVQMSGCSGKVVIRRCNFAGAHDDPINVHGTHLRVVDYATPRRLTLRYMHPQTFGFDQFAPATKWQ